MATRQYIGARYVPMFYDYEGSTEWRSGTPYEPLTIVTRNGNSYTSKKPVPSNIGSPESNPTYWASTGIYNSQIEAYRSETQAVANSLSSIEDKFKYDLPTVDPKDFGAVGDGTTDDTDAVAEAAEIGIISSPGSIFYITENIEIPYGAKDTVFKLDKDVTILSSGNWFDCHFEKTAYSTEDRGKWALKITGNVYGFVIGCSFKDMNSGLYLMSCKGFHVDNNTFDHLPQTAYAQGGNGYGVLVEDCKDVVISDNVFINVGRHSVYITQSMVESENHTNENVVIIGNLFKWDSDKTGDFSGNETTIAVRACRHNLVINNNTFDSVMSMCVIHGQQSGGVWNKVDNLAIEGNVCYNVHNESTTRKNDGVISIIMYQPETAESVTNAVIRNNHFGDVLNTSICRLDGAKHVIFENNDFSVTGTLATNAIRTQPDGTTCFLNSIVVKNCRMKDAAGYMFALPMRSGSLVSIEGNTIETAYFMNCDGATTLDTLRIEGNCITADVYSFFGSGVSISKVFSIGNYVPGDANPGTAGLLRLRDVDPTAFKCNDGVVTGYPMHTALPSTVTNGTLFVLNDGSVYMGVNGAWKALA